MTKKALIHGTRICQIEDAEFPVSADLSWVDVADNTTTVDSYVDGKVVTYVEPTPTVSQARRAGYGSIEDQLDMQYWDQVNGTTTFKDHIAKVKSENPKPE
tara:strand:- start:1150 stop:1452 length:303 start_codon:yes stop_codon:yes gene_type:complete